MDTLPVELIDLIIANLARSALKSLRQTCKTLNAVAAPYLYPRLWLSSHPLDLEVFNLVIGNPLLRKGVKELIWDDTTFCDSLMDRDNYTKTTRAEWEGCDESDMRNGGEEGYQLFLKTSEAHHRIRKERIDEQALVAALPLLTSLESVVLTNRNLHPAPDHSEVIGKSPTIRQWEALPFVRDMPFLPHVNWSMADYDEEDVSLNAPELREIREIDFQGDQWDEGWLTSLAVARVKRPFRGLSVLMSALARTSARVQSFTVRPQYSEGLGYNHNAGLAHWWFREWHAGLDDMSCVLRNLAQLHLVVGCETAVNGRATVRRGHLSRVLASMVQIEVLALELAHLPIMDALDSEVFYPQLTELKLTECDVEPTKLFDFLNRHRETLRSLSLRYCHSRPWEWSELLHRMQDSNLCPDSVVMFSLYDRHGEWSSAYWTYNKSSKLYAFDQALADFVHRGGRYPLRPNDFCSGTPPPRFGGRCLADF